MVDYLKKSKKDLIKELQIAKDANWKLGEAFDALEDAICLCNAEGTTIFLNRACSSLLGGTRRDQFVGINFYDTLPVEKKQDLAKTFQTKTSWKGEITLINPQNKLEIPLFLSSTRHITSENETLFYTNVMKKMSNQMESKFLEDLPTAIGIWQLPDENQSFVLIGLNRAARKLISPVSLPIGKAVAETIQPPMNGQIDDFFKNVLISNKEIGVSRFSLDGIASFSVKAFPLQYNCVGICFQNPSEETSELFQCSFENFPLASYLFQHNESFTNYGLIGENQAARSLNLSENEFKHIFSDPTFTSSISNIEVGKLAEVSMKNNMEADIIQLPRSHLIVHLRNAGTKRQIENEDLLHQQQNKRLHSLLYSNSTISKDRDFSDPGSIPLLLQQPKLSRTSPAQDPFQRQPSYKEQPSLETFKKFFYESRVALSMVNSQGVFIAVNSEWCRILGYSIEEFLSDSFVPITHPSDVEKSLGLLRQMKNGEIHSFQMHKRYIHKLGHVVPCILNTTLVRDISGEILFMMGMIQEVERLRNVLDDSELTKFNGLYKSNFRRCLQGCALLDCDGTILDINSTHAALVEYTAHEMIGKHYGSFLVKEDSENIHALIHQMAEGKMQDFQAIVQAKRKKGEILWCLLQIVSATDANGATTGLICYIQNAKKLLGDLSDIKSCSV